MVAVTINDRTVGHTTIAQQHGREQCTFVYTDDWVADGWPISPELPCIRGAQSPTLGRTMFGAFQDAGPDQWGRRLATERARRHGIPPHECTPMRICLLVPDDIRPGALRFSDRDTEPAGASAWAQLPDLAASATAFAESGDVRDCTNDLLLAGSAQGGAQPKAVVRDDAGALWLAKFPHAFGPVDQGRWEQATMLASTDAGIQVAESESIPVDEHRAMFVTRRFDRAVDGARIPFVSFRTMLQLTGAQGEPSPSYVELARAVRHWSADPDADAVEWFRRAVFNAAIANNDDHMRNFGLLRHEAGWRLSPAFDVNPAPHVQSDTPLTPGGDPRDRNPLVLLDHAGAFGLSVRAARQECAQVLDGAARLVQHARDLGVGREEWQDGRMRALHERILDLRAEIAPQPGSGASGHASRRAGAVCRVCGQPLTSPDSIRAGAGPNCANRATG